jgi:hypothetical protein
MRKNYAAKSAKLHLVSARCSTSDKADSVNFAAAPTH